MRASASDEKSFFLESVLRKYALWLLHCSAFYPEKRSRRWGLYKAAQMTISFAPPPMTCQLERLSQHVTGRKVQNTRFRRVEPSGSSRKNHCRWPKEITGHALLKNELCRKGVLAINIGVIDPGFEGPISSILINFGRRDFIVKKGSPFLRISFHRCPASPKADKSSKYTREQYISNVRDEVAAYMPSTFLNMDVTAEKAAKHVIESFKNNLIIWAALFAVLLAALAIFAPLGASYVDKYIVGRDQQHQMEMEEAVEKKVEERYENKLKVLSDEVEKLKAQQKPGQETNAGSKH